MPGTVRDNPALNRFELEVDGRLALAYYELSPGVITFRHTEVPPEMSRAWDRFGAGAQRARRRPHARGLKVVPKCPFVAAYMAKHAEFNDLLL